MKKRKVISTIAYILILGVALSWMLGLFGTNNDALPYSQVVKLFRDEQVRSFTVEGKNIQMQLYTPYEGKNTIRTRLADPDGFRQDMMELIQEQHAAGKLETFDFIPEEGFSPYDLILPLI